MATDRARDDVCRRAGCAPDHVPLTELDGILRRGQVATKALIDRSGERGLMRLAASRRDDSPDPRAPARCDLITGAGGAPVRLEQSAAAARSSVFEDGPADGVAANLIVQDEGSNPLVELVALPVTFEPSGVAVPRVRGLNGPDRVGGGAEIVLGYVANAGCLARSVGGEPGSSSQRPGGSHRVAAARAGSHHPHLAAGPRARRIDRLPGPRIRGLRLLEQVQNVLRTLGSPERQELVIRIGEHPATADRDQARVADVREDHGDAAPSEMRMVRADISAFSKQTRLRVGSPVPRLRIYLPASLARLGDHSAVLYDFAVRGGVPVATVHQQRTPDSVPERRLYQPVTRDSASRESVPDPDLPYEDDHTEHASAG